MRREFVPANPVSGFPRFQPDSAVHKCREFQPHNADELHTFIGWLFMDPRSESLAWQALFEANTGLRTEEALMLRTDAKNPGEAGYVSSDGNLHVVRVKHGINPFVHIHSDLKKLMKAHTVWKAIRFPDSPWFFPGRDSCQPVHKCALSHALRRLREKFGRKITSHGMRAFYVLVRRSQGISDSVIAYEL
jgi:integrase